MKFLMNFCKEVFSLAQFCHIKIFYTHVHESIEKEILLWVLNKIETQFLIDTIEEFKPQTILTLHAPYKVVNYDGPAKELAEKISAIINYPVEASIGYPTPGSFGTYAGVERQISTITLELDEICPVQDLIKPVHEIFDELL